MTPAAEHIQLIFNEIAMSIGNSLDLRNMLKESLSTYLRKLNCSAGGVFMLKTDALGSHYYEPVITTPRSFHSAKTYLEISKHFPINTVDSKPLHFQNDLPLHGCIEDHTYFHVLELPEFGYIILIKNDDDLDPFIIKSLKPLNDKLARACLSCLQKTKIEEINTRLNDILMSSQDMVWETDADGKFIYVSDSSKELLGYQPNEMIGKCPRDFMTKSEAELVGKIISAKRLNKEPYKDMEQWVTTKDGRQICVLTNGVAVFHEGKFLGYRGVNKDITLWKNAEKQLILAKEDAENISRLKSEFIANISHEIRTPMNAIIGFSDLLAEESLNEQQKKFLSFIQTSAANLLTIINDILDLSDLESEKIGFHCADTSIPQLLYDVETLMKPKSNDKGLEFQVIQQGQLPDSIQTDKVKLQQCLTNLIGNAVKFTNAGYVHLIVSFDQENQPPLLRFAVEDTGIGIPQDKLELIFQPFTQADGSTTRVYGGTGLGLTVARQLAEKLGGRIEVKSILNQGTTFTLSIPVGNISQSQKENLAPAAQTNA
jgi:PAS domain S-box-containing protein